MVLGARFVVVLRQLNGIVAGSVGMPWHHFVIANAIGAALWAGLWTLGPYYFADLFRRWL
jgi:membrane protein DedA with SNARE-associated domain